MRPNFAEFLFYEPSTGVLRWSVTRKGRGCAAGNEVGTIKADGRYRTFVLFGKRYYCHRVAWELVNGPIQSGMCIDHIDGDGLNNRLENLRCVTLSENQRNSRKPKNNKSGEVGVFNSPHGFMVHCAGNYIGTFRDMGLAVQARDTAYRQMGFHENHGRR